MKNLRDAKLTMLVVLLTSISSWAQFTFSGEVRPRTEYRHGFKALPIKDQKAALFTDQRTRLIFDFTSETFRTKISVQDIRTWGEVPQLATIDMLTSVHEAWAEAIVNDGLSFKFGRQEIILDDHRIFGSVDWAQQARSHDAVIAKLKKSDFKADFAVAFNNDKPQLNTTRYTVASSYKAFQYLWLHNDFGEVFGVSVLLLNNGVQATQTDTSGIPIPNEYKTFYTQTGGGRLTFKKEKFSANANIYTQMGKSGIGIANDYIETKVSAFLIGVDGSYKFTEVFSGTIGFERQSGNDQVNPTAGENHAFNPFYGTNHKFNGLMDYFYVGNHIGSVGLQDIFLGLDFKGKGFSTGADLHLFSSAADVNDPNNPGTAMPGNLGTELDLTFGTQITSGVALKAGYSQMFGTETLVALRGGDTKEISNWAWLMLVVKPTFIKGEK